MQRYDIWCDDLTAQEPGLDANISLLANISILFNISAQCTREQKAADIT